MPADAVSYLRTALVELGRHDHGAARDALVLAWRVSRSPVVAELVATLDPRAPDVLTAQLAAIVTPRVASSLDNLRALAKVDDPRLGAWVLAALASPPFCAVTAEPFLMLLASTLDRLRDSRLDAALPKIRSILAARITRKPVHTKVVRALDAAVARRRAVVQREAELALEHELATLIAPLQPARTVESLLAEVYAHPDSDAPRMVLADLLLERGDPRGELITLQLARGRGGSLSAREVELLKTHGRSWLGPLATVLSFGKSYSSTRFERGFVAEVDFIFKIEKKLPLVADDPGWSTVERGHVPSLLLEHAPLRALREVRLGEYALAALARRTDSLPAVTTVSIGNLADAPPALLHKLFPALVRLELRCAPDASGLAALGLRELELELGPVRDTEAEGCRMFIARLPQTEALVDRLTVHHGDDHVTYVRGAAGTYVVA